MSIIFADDDEFVRDVAQDMLSCVADDVIICENGAEAVKKFEQVANKVKLVILDLNMPVKDGYSAIMELRKKGYKVTCVGFSAGRRDFIRQRRGDALEVYESRVQWAAVETTQHGGRRQVLPLAPDGWPL